MEPILTLLTPSAAQTFSRIRVSTPKTRVSGGEKVGVVGGDVVVEWEWLAKLRTRDMGRLDHKLGTTGELLGPVGTKWSEQPLATPSKSRPGSWLVYCDNRNTNPGRRVRLCRTDDLLRYDAIMQTAA
jgi:hypothetical protein